jgi:hypothetical protein
MSLQQKTAIILGILIGVVDFRMQRQSTNSILTSLNSNDSNWWSHWKQSPHIQDLK